MAPPDARTVARLLWECTQRTAFRGGNPYRAKAYSQAALGFGYLMSINPDAHSIPELDHIHWGIETARKGGVPANQVLNAMTLPEITHYLRQKRRSLARAA